MRNLFAADLLVLIFGTFTPRVLILLWMAFLCLGREQHGHAPSFQTRFDVHLGDVLQSTDHAGKHLLAQLGMGDFPTAKEHRYFHSLAFLDELANIAHLVLHVMSIGTRAHFYFLDLNNRGFGSMRFLFLLVAKLAVIHHTANRRLSIRRHLHQVELLSFDLPERFVQRHHAKLLAFRTDHPNFTGADLMIDPRFSSDKPPPWLTVRFLYFYASPISCATSPRKRVTNSPSGSAGMFSPPRRRGATVLDSTSLSPI